MSNIRNVDGLAIAKGDVTGHTVIHKFGNAPNFATADGEVHVWDGAEDGATFETTSYTYSTSADIDSISSDNAADTMQVEVQGLDTNYDVVIQNATLNGITRVALSTSLIRVFGIKNTSSTGLTGHCLVWVNTADTTPADGIPDDLAKLRAVVHPENNQTEMAIYTIPADYTGYVRSIYATTAGASKSTNYIIKMKARPFGQVFQLKHKMSLADTGSSYIQHQYVEPPVFTEKTDIEITVEMTAAGASEGAVSAGFDIVLVAN